MPDLSIGNVDPADALSALSQRMANPVPTFSWTDLWQQQHSAAFTVAQSSGYDVLNDIDAALQEALANGETFDQFTQNLVPLLQDKGWWGTDPDTGAQLGSLRRLQLIYDMNMRTSYAAGKWASFQRNAESQPYLMYVHGASVHPRPQHLAWDGTTLPIDDPWWQTHYAPNGWNCSCTVVSLSNRQYDQLGSAGRISTVAPKTIWNNWTNPQTGVTTQVPDGIDPGFGYNVGEAFLAALKGGS
jgi:uncharacterized protein with gpF-like domain